MALTDTNDFVLSQEKLLEWGARVTEVRKKIMIRATALQDPRPDVLHNANSQRSRKGIKLSKREHNPDGHREHELKALAAAEQSPCLKYKKRRRKDLSHAELMDIVHESK